jgi:hypothetical protein
LPSFSRALFLGKLNSGSVYPYPVQGALSDEVKGTLSMLVEPTAKFMSERNNAAQNDENAAVPAAVLDELKGLGAFGMQVRNMLPGSCDESVGSPFSAGEQRLDRRCFLRCGRQGRGL